MAASAPTVRFPGKSPVVVCGICVALSTASAMQPLRGETTDTKEADAVKPTRYGPDSARGVPDGNECGGHTTTGLPLRRRSEPVSHRVTTTESRTESFPDRPVPGNQRAVSRVPQRNRLQTMETTSAHQRRRTTTRNVCRLARRGGIRGVGRLAVANARRVGESRARG